MSANKRRRANKQEDGWVGKTLKYPLSTIMIPYVLYIHN